VLIAITRYRDITGDTSSPSAVVESAIADAQALLEGQLRRPLEQAERTERLRVFPDRRVYPRATPIVSAAAGADIYGAAIVDGTPAGSFLYADDFVEVTYTGGYDPDETDLSAVDYVPVELQRAVAWAAYAILRPGDGVQAPAGARSVSVGDVSVTFGSGGAAAPGEVEFDRGLVRRWRWRGEMAA
jgi:hypothetical protein